MQTFGPETTIHRRLVLAASDTCKYCAAQEPIWSDMLRRIALEESEIVLLSVGGDAITRRLANVLESRSARYRLVSINSSLYAVASGISIVPLSIILDKESRIRFVTPSLPVQMITVLEETWAELRP